MSNINDFVTWWNAAPHRIKYPADHPAHLAAWEAWHDAVAAERERIASFHFNTLNHEALSAITLDADLSDARARLAYARKVADAVARSFAWQLKQAFEQVREPR